MHRRLIAPGALAAASLMLAIPASAASHSPGAPGIGDPYYPAYGNGGYDVSHYDLRLKYQPKTDRLEGTATILATHHAGPVALQPGLPAGRQRGAGQRREGVVHDLRRARAGDHPEDAAGQGHADHRRGALQRGAVQPKSAYGFTTLAPHPGRRRRGATSPRRPGGGSRATTTRSTRRPTTCRSPCPTAPRPSPTARCSRRVHSSAGPATTGAPNKPQATYLATLAVGKFDITTGTTESGLPVVNAYSKDLGDNDGRGAGERRADRRDRRLAERLLRAVSRSTRSAGMCRTRPPGTRWRPRPGPSTARSSSRTAPTPPSSCTSWPTSGTATACPLDGLEGHLDQRGLRAVRASGCGPSTRARARRRNSPTTCTPRIRPTTRSGRSSRATRVRTTSSTSPSTTGARWPSRRCATRSVTRRSSPILKGWPQEHAYGNASVADFRAYAEQVSGKSLGSAVRHVAVPAVEAGAPAAHAVSLARQSKAPVQPKSWKKIAATNSVH